MNISDGKRLFQQGGLYNTFYIYHLFFVYIPMLNIVAKKVFYFFFSFILQNRAA